MENKVALKVSYADKPEVTDILLVILIEVLHQEIAKDVKTEADFHYIVEY